MMTKEQLIVLLETILSEQATKHMAWMSETEYNIVEGNFTTYDGALVLSEVAERLLEEMKK